MDDIKHNLQSDCLLKVLVIRLSHCQKQIFCFSVPDECPNCGEELKGRRLTEAPVSLPSPLSNGHKSCCCLLLAPSSTNDTSCVLF
uniref:MKRN2 opposite strand protein-like N-terminal domain-containing protein n=1 Tax=Sphaeramia orbicularis TaxID=375764 RepID=A0A672ZGU1_9TELE